MKLMDKNKKKMIELLKKVEIIKFGEFTLASGKTSSFYIDLRLLPSHPDVFKQICEFGAQTIRKQLDINSIDALVGIPMAAIPYATLLGQHLKKPQLLLRKQIKDHGTKKKLEGDWSEGQEILLIDDLITSGVSKEEPIQNLKELNLQVNHLFVFINRSELSKQRLEKNLGVTLHSILDINDLEKAKLLE